MPFKEASPQVGIIVTFLDGLIEDRLSHFNQTGILIEDAFHQKVETSLLGKLAQVCRSYQEESLSFHRCSIFRTNCLLPFSIRNRQSINSLLLIRYGLFSYYG